MNKKIIEFRKSWKSKTLRLNPHPDSDKSFEEKHANILKRLDHLSEVLFMLYNMYRDNKELYGDKFLAFVGNSVVREWPWKDFPFTSKKFENGEPKRYEHWTPISFFRDLFQIEDMTKEDFYDALTYYYRIVIISSDEDNVLNKKHKTTRAIDTYSDLGIEIKEQDLWNKLYSDIDKAH